MLRQAPVISGCCRRKASATCISQIAPGINILGLVILIGWRVAGAPGVAMALGGLLLPSAAITVALTAVYANIKQAPTVRAALSGVVPATVPT